MRAALENEKCYVHTTCGGQVAVNVLETFPPQSQCFACRKIVWLEDVTEVPCPPPKPTLGW